ncbi:MAG: hypothetical protein QOF56_844 [Acidobacteriaceae bacterium]|nr:hypothetical protein [Acidobacteriaceae bacterium]
MNEFLIYFYGVSRAEVYVVDVWVNELGSRTYVSHTALQVVHDTGSDMGCSFYRSLGPDQRKDRRHSRKSIRCTASEGHGLRQKPGDGRDSNCPDEPAGSFQRSRTLAPVAMN